MKLFYLVDFLGKKPTLLLAKEPSHKSLLGGILSLVTIAAILAGLGYFASILLARQTFSLIQNEALDNSMSMSLIGTPLGVSIFSSNAIKFANQSRVYGVTLINYKFRTLINDTLNTTFTTTDMEQIQLEPCNLKSMKYPKFQELMEKENQVEGFCLPSNLDLNLNATFGYANYSGLKFFFYKCQNNTAIGKNDCLPPSEIDSLLKNVYLATFFIDYVFDHNNLNNPAQPYIRKESIITGATPYFFRELTINMRNVDYRTDLNYLVTNPETVQYNSVDSIKDSTIPLQDNVIPGSFCSLSINMGSVRLIFNRRYYKLQNMLADLGGLVKALVTITLNLNLYFSNKTFFNNVIDANINSLYIKSIRKSLLLDVVGGEGKRRGTVMIDQGGNKHQTPDTDLQDQENALDDVIYEAKYHDKPKAESEQGSPKKLIQNNKSIASEIGQNSERVPVKEKDEITIRSDNSKHNRMNSNVELVKLSGKEISKDESGNALPNSVQLKKNKDVVFNKFQINFCGYIFPGCCFKKGSQTHKQLELHSKFTDIIKGHMDILYISKKLHTVDKLNYVLCGDKYKKLLETTINPYLYDGAIPYSSDIYEARKKIISELKM